MHLDTGQLLDRLKSDELRLPTLSESASGLTRRLAVPCPVCNDCARMILNCLEASQKFMFKAVWCEIASKTVKC
jgi:hypothetical protein